MPTRYLIQLREKHTSTEANFTCVPFIRVCGSTAHVGDNFFVVVFTHETVDHQPRTVVRYDEPHKHLAVGEPCNPETVHARQLLLLPFPSVHTAG